MHLMLLQSLLLINQLTDYVDNFVGDRLAELPDQDRSLGPLSALAGPISVFAAAVLKFKLDSPACIKLLRRLLAALLPDNTSGQYSYCDNVVAVGLILCCAVLVLCCAVPCRAVLCGAVLCCAHSYVPKHCSKTLCQAIMCCCTPMSSITLCAAVQIQ